MSICLRDLRRRSSLFWGKGTGLLRCQAVLRFDNVKGNAPKIASGKGTTLSELVKMAQLIANICKAKELWGCAPEVCLNDSVEEALRWYNNG